MKYRIGSITIEAIDTYVRVTVANFGGPGNPDRVACTRRQCPADTEVIDLLAELRGGHYDMTPAIMQAAGRAAQDTRDNRDAAKLDL
jgi:hypothetical protein